MQTNRCKHSDTRAAVCEGIGCGTVASTARTNSEGISLPSSELECETTVNKEWGVK